MKTTHTNCKGIFKYFPNLYSKIYWIDFVFLSFITLGSSTGTIVRPKVHYARPPHPPPDPPIPEASVLGPETRHSLFTPHCLAQAELEHTKQRHSFPDRLVRSRSSDIVCPGRRPTSDPGLNRRVAVEERDPAGAFALGPSSSPSKDSLKGEVTCSSSAQCLGQLWCWQMLLKNSISINKCFFCSQFQLFYLITYLLVPNFDMLISIQRLRIGKTVMMRSLIATDHGGKNVLCQPFPKVRKQATWSF